MAALLDHLVAREAERKALGAEVLHLYREINLIYSFSEKLAALLDLERVARADAAGGAAPHRRHRRRRHAARRGHRRAARRWPAFGDGVRRLTGVHASVDGIIGAVAATGVAEIVDDVEPDPRRVADDTTLRSLICAPLKVGERVIGVIALGSTHADGLHRRRAQAAQHAGAADGTAIENARLFERTVQAARERERLLALHKETEVARAKLESELELAARIQADLFPAALPRVPGYDLAARNRPARRCGGDYYDALPASAPDGTSVCCSVSPTSSGKGLPAALVMSNMQATLRALLEPHRLAAGAGRRGQRSAVRHHSAEKYVTAAFVELVPATGA